MSASRDQRSRAASAGRRPWRGSRSRTSAGTGRRPWPGRRPRCRRTCWSPSSRSAVRQDRQLAVVAGRAGRATTAAGAGWAGGGHGGYFTPCRVFQHTVDLFNTVLITCRHDRTSRRSDRRRRHLRHQRRLAPAGPLPVEDLRDPRAPREHGRHLGPVQVPGHPLGLRHVHPRLPVQAMDVGQGHRRRPVDPGTTSRRPPPRTASTRTSATATRSSPPTGPTPTTAGPSPSTRGGEEVTMTCSFLFAASGYYNYDQGYSPTFAGLRGLRGHHRAPAALARGPRLRGQEDRRDRQRRHRHHADPRAGQQRRRPRHDAAALAVLHRLAARRRPDRRAGQQVPAREGRPRGQPVEGHHLQHRPVPAGPALPEVHAQDAADDGRSAGCPRATTSRSTSARSYNPWDQRLCLAPNGDLFKTIRKGKADVVTDTIDRFAPRASS